MKALSDPSRVRALKLLEGLDLCVCELQLLLGLAQSTVSKHMKTLEDAGLVVGERQGAWIIYRLAEGDESEYAANMLEKIPGWLNDDQELALMRLKIPEAQALRDTWPR